VQHALAHGALVFLESQSPALRVEVVLEGVTDWDVDQVLDTSPALNLGRAPNVSNVKLRIIHHPRLTHPELDKFALKRAGCIVPAVAEHVVVWSHTLSFKMLFFRDLSCHEFLSFFLSFFLGRQRPT